MSNGLRKNVVTTREKLNPPIVVKSKKGRIETIQNYKYKTVVVYTPKGN